MNERDALLIVDPQNDFFPDGALGVKGGYSILYAINHLIDMAEKNGVRVVVSRDWHPEGHCSFTPGGPWPPHCVQGTEGASFHPQVRLPGSFVCVSKAYKPQQEAYSAFTGTHLADLLTAMGVERVVICGLATDYCVRYTSIDAAESGFDVVVITDGCAGVSPLSTEEAMNEMKKIGIALMSLAEFKEGPDKQRPESTESGEMPERAHISEQYKWDMSAMYETREKWEEDYKKVEEAIPEMESWAGTLCESPDTLLKCLTARDTVMERMSKVYSWAARIKDEDTRVAEAQAEYDRCMGLYVRMSEAISYMVPEILSTPKETVDGYVANNPGLSVYKFHIDELYRHASHVLSPQEEAIMAALGEVMQAPDNAFSMLTNADMVLPGITDASNKKVEMSEERYGIYVRSKERRVRKEAYESLFGTYGKYKNTLGATLGGTLKCSAFVTKTRKYGSSLECALFEDAVPLQVYHSLVDTIEAGLGSLHRYAEYRRGALGIAQLMPYDLYVPIAPEPASKIPWDSAVAQVLSGIAPLGETYVQDAERGINARWIDVYENRGKRSGAYSAGTYGTHPYILLNYNSTIRDVFTLAHELGHSMHSYYSCAAQPFITSDYSIFVAEVASTCNEILLLEHMIKSAPNPQVRAYLLEQRLEQIRTTVYRQVMFASFERTIHAMADSQEPITPDMLCSIWCGLNEKYYGPALNVDSLLHMEWARIPHFYSPFYVYMYATSYAAATQIAADILSGDKHATERYLNLLKSGGSDHPINLLKTCGVDMSTPAPIQQTIKVFAETLAELEKM